MTVATELRLYDDLDAPWIEGVLDIVAANTGAPWRIALDRIERRTDDLGTHPARVTTVVRALRRMLGRNPERARIARQARALVLGHPAVDAGSRMARIAAVAANLRMPAAEVESLLWADLALEQPVALPESPPSPLALIAAANLDRIQRAVRRARSVQLRVWDAAHALVRMAARYGLVARIHREAGGATVLDITGPLALFHATTIYGRAIAQLIPLLADHERFELDIACEFDGLASALRVAPPIRLPPVVVRRRAPTAADRLATDLVATGLGVEREPPPIVAGAELVFPDLAVRPVGVGGEAHVGADRETDRWLIEVVGFSTAAYLASKQAAYREAGIERAILCVDADRAAPDEVGTSPRARASPPIVWFLRRVDASAVIAAIAADP